MAERNIPIVVSSLKAKKNTINHRYFIKHQIVDLKKIENSIIILYFCCDSTICSKLELFLSINHKIMISPCRNANIIIYFKVLLFLELLD